MLFKANHALEKVADYTKLPDGTWVVEIRALQLRVSAPTPSACRFRLLAEFDERMAAWILTVAEGGSTGEPRPSPEI